MGRSEICLSPLLCHLQRPFCCTFRDRPSPLWPEFSWAWLFALIGSWLFSGVSVAFSSTLPRVVAISSSHPFLSLCPEMGWLSSWHLIATLSPDLLPGLYLSFIKFAIEKVVSHNQVHPDTVKSFPITELNTSFYFLCFLNVSFIVVKVT